MKKSNLWEKLIVTETEEDEADLSKRKDRSSHVLKTYKIELVYNDLTEACSCRCIHHCGCDCDRKGM